jgi:hypothetical protein
MNSKSLLTRIAVPVLSLGLLGGLGATLATSASAATVSTVTANTHLNNHTDTTSVPTGVTSDNGPVWAYDNITEKYTVTTKTAPSGTTPGTYLVKIDVVGSFHGFANPRTQGEMDALGLTSPDPGAALDSAGSVKGTISYNVTATQAPDASLLPGQSPSDATLSQNINLLFGGTVVGAPAQVGAYGFTYHQVEGQDYTQ